MLSYIDHAKFDYFMLSFSQGQLQNEQSSNFLAIALLIHSDHFTTSQLLATGCIDISNYITERPGKLDVTVTLKPAIKKVVSGKIEFELSWVMQEDDQVIQ